MILNDQEVQERIESPLNLLNRLKRASENKPTSPCLPSAGQVIEDLDGKIKNGSIKSKAAGILADALDEIKLNIPNMKPEKLTTVAREMNQILVSRQSNDSEKSTQIIVYAPQVVNENIFETIHVKE